MSVKKCKLGNGFILNGFGLTLITAFGNLVNFLGFQGFQKLTRRGATSPRSGFRSVLILLSFFNYRFRYFGTNRLSVPVRLQLEFLGFPKLTKREPHGQEAGTYFFEVF